MVLYDREREDREAIAREIAQERGAVLVPPYDDPLVIAGQGTVGREIVEEIARLGLTLDCVVVNASGGGLTAGIALAVKARAPAASIYTAEPAAFDDHIRSFLSGKRERNPALTGTICDALMAQSPGKLTFEINRVLVGHGVTATEEEVGRAVAFAFRELKLVVEPGGAVGPRRAARRPSRRRRQDRGGRAVRRQRRSGTVRAPRRVNGAARSPSVPVASRRYDIHTSAWVLAAADLLPLPACGERVGVRGRFHEF